ncbi:hypothetical protein CQS04_11910 [Chryseomicrobium excrementi]|uniref:Uncharacterized protein n=1 Tax=Chryseomicrobium excrementi TaxID=2041346 RepID=A0A2M9EXJ2_9BACL|nr:hypothetical protein [Chryseomicrobium excrementi]PJK15933.1 hypothetical protein CQS04_11910 [Chryseomicrobium excrementi]
MTFITNKVTNAVFIALLSLVYGGLFLLISGHMEFLSTLPPKASVNYGFWNTWLTFIYDGGLTIIGYTILGITVAIGGLSFFGSYKKLDEYQSSLLLKVIMVSGLITLVSFPLLVINVLSEPLFAIPFTLFFVVVIWLFFQITYLLFLIKLR